MDSSEFPALDDLEKELQLIMNNELPTVRLKAPDPCETGGTIISDDKASAEKCHTISQFGETLQQKSGSTSTPINPRTKSHTESPRHERHDSGFTDSLLLTYAQDDAHESQCKSEEEPSHSEHDTQCNILTSKFVEHSHHDNAHASQPDSGYGDSQLSRLSQTSEADSGLKRMQDYYDSLNRTCSLAKVIGRRMGTEYIDIISELDNLHIPCLKTIFNMLSNRDLQRCSKVSERWKSIVLSDKQLKLKVDIPDLPRNPGKENSSPTKEDPITSMGASGGIPLLSMKDRTNTAFSASPIKSPGGVSSPESSNDTSLFNRFTREAKKLKAGEKFVKCVRCSAPAKLYVEARQAKCTRKRCRYDFCTLCELEFHGARDCITQPNKKSRTNDQPINSKKSKKHLKRLL